MNSLYRILKSKNQKSILHGLLITTSSLFIVFRFALLYYQYNFTDILFNFMYSNLTLAILILLSIIGFSIGLLVITKKQNYQTAYFEILLLLVIGLIVDQIAIS